MGLGIKPSTAYFRQDQTVMPEEWKANSVSLKRLEKSEGCRVLVTHQAAQPGPPASCHRQQQTASVSECLRHNKKPQARCSLGRFGGSRSTVDLTTSLIGTGGMPS
jgi:hypothetical protein